ncbi:MAG: DNA polymerase III subunit alpha [Spirochaetales bacterium]|nr:DNA polymerase III subunit alpha [Spirochaetales bacterium]
MKKNLFKYSFIHCRSQYSLLNGVLSFRQICEKASSSGGTVVGLTDINNFHGMPEFLETASGYGLRPVIGSVITTSVPRHEREYLFTAYCLNRSGFQRLNSIITRLNYDSSPYKTSDCVYDPVSDLLENGREGLLVVSSRTSVLERLREAGREGLYTGLFCGMPFDGLLKFSRRLDLPAAALNEVVYFTPSDLSALHLLRAVDRRTAARRMDGGSDPVLACGAGAASGAASAADAGGPEFGRFFSAVPGALAGTAEIAEAAADAELLPSAWVFPSYDGLSEAAAAEKLYSLCRQGVSRRYKTASAGEGLLQQVDKRLRYELNIICKKGFAGYFLVVWDIVRQAPRTCGRGSAASSIVSYLLGITHVDPLAYNLFFERFLNMNREDPPDIDVDFPWDEREKALSYVFEKYAGSSGMVADHVCFKRRAAAREAAKALGMTETHTIEMMKKWRGGRGQDLPPQVAQAAALLYGRPRYIGTHPGGVVITPGPLSAYTHAQPSASGVPVIAWEKDGTEAAGLIKIDILGNRSLAVLRDTITLVNRERQDELDWENFQPYRDVRTKNYIESGDTAGIFYIESPATRQLLKKMGCADFEHVVVASSIIRPAANKWINEYVRRLKGGSYQPLDPILEGVLDETHGIMVYQEDVARVAIAAAGFNPGEADQLRKTLSKKNRASKLVIWKESFMKGACDRGLREQDAKQLWQGILSFDGYSFCKSHSASYALVSYRLAWLKLRYPLEFMISVINNGGGFYPRQVYLNIVRRLGFPVLKPDVNLSSAAYQIEVVSPGIKALRAGLSQIRELSADFISAIIVNRNEQGPFRSFGDFVKRVPPSYRDIRMLIKSGSLDAISSELNRPQMFWKYYHHGKSGGREFFGEPEVPPLAGYSSSVRLSDEIETLDLFFSEHPAAYFKGRASDVMPGKCIDSRELGWHIGRQVSVIGTLAARKEVLTSTQKAMSFVSFEDAGSIFETIFFPDEWEAFEPVIAMGFAFLITGLVENDLGAEYINVKNLRCLNRMRTVS